MPYRRSTALPHDHAVTFYDEDDDLAASVADFVMEGVALGEPTIMVATVEHRAIIDETLLRRGLDVHEAKRSGQLRLLDAEETLASLIRGGLLDAPTIRLTVGALIDATAANGKRVRVFGEMVALLWKQGNVAAAIELEGLWNDLAAGRRFSLLCAYPVEMLGGTSLDDLDQVCCGHSSVAPPRSYAAPRASTPDLPAVADQASRVFVCVPAAVPAVRRFVIQVLSEWDLADAIPDAVLVASELATNALRHTHSPFRVAVDRSGPTVRVAVEDLGRDQPTLCALTDDTTWGRGVFIVDEVCSAWGTEQLPLGKVVWADMRVPG